MLNSNHYEFVEVRESLLHMKLIGFWNNEIGHQFLADWIQAVDLISGSSFIVIADLSEFRPHSKKMHYYLEQAMKYANENGLFKAIEVFSDALQRIGLESAERKSGQRDFRVVVGSIKEARALYKQLKPGFSTSIFMARSSRQFV